MRIVLDKMRGLRGPNLLQQLPSVPQTLHIQLNEVLLVGLVWTLHDVVQQHSLYFQILRNSAFFKLLTHINWDLRLEYIRGNYKYILSKRWAPRGRRPWRRTCESSPWWRVAVGCPRPSTWPTRLCAPVFPRRLWCLVFGKCPEGQSPTGAPTRLWSLADCKETV